MVKGHVEGPQHYTGCSLRYRERPDLEKSLVSFIYSLFHGATGKIFTSTITEIYEVTNDKRFVHVNILNRIPPTHSSCIHVSSASGFI
jgi:hypothetical protein